MGGGTASVGIYTLAVGPPPGFLVKPFTAARLLEALADLLDRAVR